MSNSTWIVFDKHFTPYSMHGTPEEAGEQRDKQHGAMPELEFKVTTAEAFDKGRKDHYLSKPADIITESDYTYALEALPPLRRSSIGQLGWFLMSELYTGSLTYMYGRLRCGASSFHVRKLVDIADQSTWFTEEQVKAMQEEWAKSKLQGFVEITKDEYIGVLMDENNDAEYVNGICIQRRKSEGSILAIESDGKFFRKFENAAP